MRRKANWGDSLIKCMEQQLYLKGIGKCKKCQLSLLPEVKIKFLRIYDHEDTKMLTTNKWNNVMDTNIIT